jgi:hypothetical protein
MAAAGSRRTQPELVIPGLGPELDAERLHERPVLQVYGVSIECEWELDKAPTSGGHPQIRISSVPAEAIPQTKNLPSFRPYYGSPLSYTPLPDGRSVISWADLFSFVVSRDGATILGHAQSTLAPDALRAHLFGAVVSFALLRLGYEPLHATALTFDGQALALLGDSGTGKSTLAAALLASGARLLTDDLLVLTYEQDVPLAQPGLPRIKLMPDAAACWPQGGAGAPFHPGSPKRVFRLNEESFADSPAPLRACFVLRRDHEVATCLRWNGAAAMQEIAANAFNTLDVRAERLRAHFEAAARLARHVPVFELNVPNDLQRIEEAVQLVGATLAMAPRSSRA